MGPTDEVPGGSGAGDEFRAMLLGETPIEGWPPEDSPADAEPWRSFAAARDAWRSGATEEAQRLWLDVAGHQGLESRHVLQAWHFLRAAGTTPPDDVAKHVLGAVAEVAVPQGHDLLAVYEDGSARYLNVSGAVAVIDAPVPSVQAAGRDLLAVAQSIADAIGPWEGPLPPLPPGHDRLIMLTPSGPHFGQGPDEQLRQDPAASAFLEAATAALLAVVDVATPHD